MTRCEVWWGQSLRSLVYDEVGDAEATIEIM